MLVHCNGKKQCYDNICMNMCCTITYKYDVRNTNIHKSSCCIEHYKVQEIISILPSNLTINHLFKGPSIHEKKTKVISFRTR